MKCEKAALDAADACKEYFFMGLLEPRYLSFFLIPSLVRRSPAALLLFTPSFFPQAYEVIPGAGHIDDALAVDHHLIGDAGAADGADGTFFQDQRKRACNVMPVVNESEPLAPAWPAFPVRMLKTPLEVSEP